MFWPNFGKLFYETCDILCKYLAKGAVEMNLFKARTRGTPDRLRSEDRKLGMRRLDND